ncbi:uncharacterized protein MONOS_9448 [Monocercomonoides exilis]|uniref:uncharacterized protein n=1 Tax=Monocercomonoides exilis TaxID=2049356 RepID=UPI00355AA5B4|nr:hypothetical protein MONOS_9448 [Monocercomonoides exilis]
MNLYFISSNFLDIFDHSHNIYFIFDYVWKSYILRNMARNLMAVFLPVIMLSVLAKDTEAKNIVPIGPAVNVQNVLFDHIGCIETSISVINTSLCVTHLNIIPLAGYPLLTAQHHSAASILYSTCQAQPATKSPLFLSAHASLALTNISLTTHQPAILSFPLFSTPNNLLSDAHSPIPVSFSISHSSFSSFISLTQPFLFSPSSISSPSLSPSPSSSSFSYSSSSSSSSSPSPSPSPSISSSPSPSPSISSSPSPSPLHVHHQPHPHLQIHLNLHLSNTLFSNISSPQSHLSLPSLPSHSLNPFTSTTSSSSLSSTTTNININSIPSFSLHSSLFIHSSLFKHTHNPIDGFILPNLNDPSTSLSAFNASFLHQTRTLSNAPVVHVGNETDRKTPGRMSSFDLNSHRFEWCEWNDSNGGSSSGGALYVSCTNANLTITSCSFDNCSTSDHGGALCCYYLLKINIAKSNFTNCYALHGGATVIDGRQSSSVYSFSENRVESCSITDWCGTGWYYRLNDLSASGQFLFTKCKCIANSGGDSTGSLTFNYPPYNKPNQFLVNDCQFINNKLTASVKYGGAAVYFRDTYSWMNGIKFITFCFFDGNTAKNGRGNDVFFNGSSITQSPFENCGSTTPTKRVYNNGQDDNPVYNGWLPLIAQNKIVTPTDPMCHHRVCPHWLHFPPPRRLPHPPQLNICPHSNTHF